MLKLQEVED
jgi:SWI/SNF-related matrix-associated actin-dependent regulator of chromatin subfamily A member 5